MIEKNILWKTVLEVLKINLSAANFATWFPNTFIQNIQNVNSDHLIVEIACPSSFIRDTVENRYYGQIKTALDQQVQKKCDLVFLVKQTEIKPKFTPAPLFDQNQPVSSPKIESSNYHGLNPSFTFENFIVGNANNMAHAAAQGIIANPGKAYNPFFIYGGVGVGKTHLMQAIGHALLEKHPQFKIIYVTAETFTNDLVSSLQDKSTTSFKKKYRSPDALLIDDIQFIAGKEYIQEEFFHTFNALYMVSKQIALTSDRRPEDLAKVEDRLISRFMGGLTVDIQSPDYEMRLAILKQKTASRQKYLPSDVLDFIANQPFSNARQLEGILTQILAKSEVQREIIDLEFVKNFFGLQKKSKSSQVNPREVISEVAKLYEFKVNQLTGPIRKAPLVNARHLAMFILRNDFEIPLAKIGDLFGGRDHTTILHAVDKIKTQLSQNSQLRENLINVRSSLYKI